MISGKNPHPTSPVGKAIKEKLEDFDIGHMFSPSYFRTIDLVWERSAAKKEWDKREKEGDAFLPAPTANMIGGSRSSDPSTSKKAAVDVFPRTGSQRHRILSTLWHFESVLGHGTPQRLNYEDLNEYAKLKGSWKRLSELKRGGWVEVSGQSRVHSTGSYADAYVLTDQARKYIHDNPQEFDV